MIGIVTHAIGHKPLWIEYFWIRPVRVILVQKWHVHANQSLNTDQKDYLRAIALFTYILWYIVLSNHSVLR